jgi:hypothetical protein
MAKIGKIFGVDMNRDFTLGLVGTGLIIALMVVALSPWKAFALVIGVLVFVFAFYNPEYIIIFLVAYTPFEPFLLKFVSDDIYIYARYFSESLIYVLVASIALRIALGTRKLVSTPLDLPFIFFLMVALTSLIVNYVPLFTGLLGLRQIIRFILLFFLTVYLNPDRAFIRRVTIVMLGIVLFQGLLGGIQSLVGGPLDEFLIPSERRFYESIQLTSGTTQFWSPGTRVFATLGRYDQLGTFLCFFFLIIVGLLYYKSATNTRRSLSAILLLSLPAFVMTLSRASWFGLIAGVTVVGAFIKKDWRVRSAILASIVCIGLYLAYTGLVVKYLTEYPEQTPVERFFEAFSYERWRGEYYGLGRVYWIVQTPLVVVRSSPLFGVGPGQFGGGAAAALGNTRVYEKLNLPFGVYGSEGYIDNNWFSLWGETGTLGLIFYVWMFVMLGRMALKTWHESRDTFTKGLALGYFGAVLAVALQAFLATYLEVRTVALYLWLYGAFVYVLARKEEIYE